MFLFDKFYQSIKKPGQFARLSFYHVLMFLVTVAYLDVEQPFKGFRQVHQVGGLAVLIHDVFGEEQTAYHFHDVDKGCLVCEIERGKGCLLIRCCSCSGYLMRHSIRRISVFKSPIASSIRCRWGIFFLLKPYTIRFKTVQTKGKIT